MGQHASRPQPGAKLRVIGAGLPRTGTESISEALAILLDGPVYHCGTQLMIGDEKNVRTWIDILQRTPIRDPADKAFIRAALAAQLDGYVATADCPSAQFLPELLELHPDVAVICTVRDPDAWARSMEAMATRSLKWYLRLVLLPVPTMRFHQRYIDVLLPGRWGELYHRQGDPNMYGRAIWERHIEWLRSVVPPDQLFFYDVKDGWEPLCRILDVEVPKGVEFPRSNDGDAMEAFAKRQVQRGLMRWAGILGALGIAAGVIFRFRRR